MTRPTIVRNGKRFALVEVTEIHRLELLAARAEGQETGLPPLPPANARGNLPAVAFARASLARSICEERVAAGLTQLELARLAGVRQETVSRLESGKHSPTARTVEKIDRALQAALKSSRPGKQGKRRSRSG